MTLRIYFDIFVTGPLECGCHTLSEGGCCAFLLFCVQVVCGDWLEEQWDAVKRGPVQTGPPDSQPACGIAVFRSWPFRLQQIQIVCVVLRGADTLFRFELLNNRKVIRVDRGKKLFFFSMSFFL